MSQIHYISFITKVFFKCFFELLDIGLLSDDEFEKQLQSGKLEKVKQFKEFDLSPFSNSFLSDDCIIIHAVEMSIEELNKYLAGISLDSLSVRLSEFDEYISNDNYERVTAEVPKDNEQLSNWFRHLWKIEFERISSFEKSIHFANDLHQGSVDEIDSRCKEIQKRINVAGSNVDELSKQISGDNGQGGLIQKVQETDKSILSLKDEVQGSTVTILGIFAAIVLAFSGVFSFSASIMQSINSASIYRLIAVCSLLGLISFNIIFCLMRFLLHNHQNQGFTYLLPLWVTDAILVIILLLTFVAWYNHWLTP